MPDPSEHRLGLDADALLSTTRAVRKRLDLERPVDPALVDECLGLAAQAPTGSNAQGWHFVVVTDPDTRARLGELYRDGFQLFYGDREAAEAGLPADDPDYVATTRRVIDSAEYLAEHMGEVPVMVVPCIEGRTDGGNVMIQASVWGSLLPAVWSFMLAARERGLGTCWTTLHLLREAEAAELLGLPDTVMQGALIPVAHTIGTDFRPGPRRDMTRIVHHDRW
jgi:nitroreductase